MPTTPRPALDWIAGHAGDCDLMIIDILLRSSSGTDVLRQLQGQPAAPKRLVLTNYATPEIRNLCLGLGAAAVFDKSSDIELLIDYCERLAAAAAGGRPLKAALARDRCATGSARSSARSRSGRCCWQLELFHHARAVGADGLDAQEHALGDVADGLALGQAQEDLQLALATAPRAAAARRRRPRRRPAVRPPPA